MQNIIISSITNIKGMSSGTGIFTHSKRDFILKDVEELCRKHVELVNFESLG